MHMNACTKAVIMTANMLIIQAELAFAILQLRGKLEDDSLSAERRQRVLSLLQALFYIIGTLNFC